MIIKQVNSIRNFLTILFSLSFFTLYPLNYVLAQNNFITKRLKSFGDKAGYNTEAPNVEYQFTAMLGIIVGALLGLLGVIFLVLTIYSGFTWMTAAGEEAKVTKAKDTLQRAIIGLIIIAGSFAIWSLVIVPLL